MSKEEKPQDFALSPDVPPLQELYDLMLEEGLDALEIKDGESHIRLSRRWTPSSHGFSLTHPPPRSAEAQALAPSKTPSTPTHVNAIATPLAGVFYRASSSTSAPFVKEGDLAETGQTLCIVEAMKVMNEIKAESRCRIIKILAENSRPVIAGQALFHVEPA